MDVKSNTARAIREAASILAAAQHLPSGDRFSAVSTLKLRIARAPGLSIAEKIAVDTEVNSMLDTWF